jgi:FtsP/CotA-like multicopper oxidase with cupredoxin domain
MSTTRRDFLAHGTALGAAGWAGLASAPIAAQTTASAATDPAAKPGKVRTLNGWTLPYRLIDGVKEFHLVAEEVEHEFAPGALAKCWGYNGSTPGPTIEANEGDRVRILLTNKLGEPTSMHWHGLLLPSGMDGVSGLTQPSIKPDETYAYEFTLRQHGSHMYHPHADEMTQMALGMMGMFVIHPRGGEPLGIDRDYALIMHNFDYWTFNSKVFPAIEPMVARSGERVRVRVGNLSMWNHPVHMHGVQFEVTGGDGGRWPRALWRREVTELVGVGQVRDLEFVAVPGDWAFHCHMSHHTMGPMGHEIPNPIGVKQDDLAAAIRAHVPGYMGMGEHGMAEHQDHTDSGHMRGPSNTLAMMAGNGPHGNMEMGGMFTVIKVRDDLAVGDYRDPGWYRAPASTVAKCISRDPELAARAPRRPA